MLLSCNVDMQKLFPFGACKASYFNPPKMKRGTCNRSVKTAGLVRPPPSGIGRLSCLQACFSLDFLAGNASRPENDRFVSGGVDYRRTDRSAFFTQVDNGVDAIADLILHRIRLPALRGAGKIGAGRGDRPSGFQRQASGKFVTGKPDADPAGAGGEPRRMPSAAARRS
jgi:hypothetical protein